MSSGVPQRAGELRKIWGAFRASRVLMTANHYRLFDHLSTPRSAEKLAKILHTDPRATEILLDAVTGLGLLVKKHGRYRNADMAMQFLVKGKPYYQGDIISHADALWKNWSGLDQVVKTGKPCRRERDHEAFIMGMHNLASMKAVKILRLVGLTGVRNALDLGGGPGTYAIEMAKRGVNVTLFDSPETIDVAEKIIGNHRKLGIRLVGGDFMVDDIGKGYDLVFVSQILHAYSVAENQKLLRKCRKSLSKGGRIAVQEFYIHRERTYPLQGALFSVNMLVNTENGRCYSPEEIKSWLSKAKLEDIRERFYDDSVLISAARK